MAGEQLYIVETDGPNGPYLPPVFYGPIERILPAKWIAENEDCAEPPVSTISTELIWPTDRRYRRIDWLFHGVRPPNACPRGLATTLVPDPASSNPPPEELQGPFELLALNVPTSERDAANFQSKPFLGTVAELRLELSATEHSSSADPLSITADDFLLDAVLLFTDGAGRNYRLSYGPAAWDGSGQPSDDKLECVILRTLPRENRIEQIRVKLSPPTQCGPLSVLPPLVDPANTLDFWPSYDGQITSDGSRYRLNDVFSALGPGRFDATLINDRKGGKSGSLAIPLNFDLSGAGNLVQVVIKFLTADVSLLRTGPGIPPAPPPQLTVNVSSEASVGSDVDVKTQILPNINLIVRVLWLPNRYLATVLVDDEIRAQIDQQDPSLIINPDDFTCFPFFVFARQLDGFVLNGQSIEQVAIQWNEQFP